MMSDEDQMPEHVSRMLANAAGCYSGNMWDITPYQMTYTFLWDSSYSTVVRSASMPLGQEFIMKGYHITIPDGYHEAVPKPDVIQALYHATLRVSIICRESFQLSLAEALPRTDYWPASLVKVQIPIVFSAQVLFDLNIASLRIPTQNHECVLTLSGLLARSK